MAELLLYGLIGEPADGLDAKTVCAAVRGATGPLSIRINSPGGFVMDGLAIITALRDYAGPITIYIDGLAASMASAIAMVGTNTVMAQSALMMLHSPWDSSIGNADDLRRDAAALDRIEQQLIGIYAARTGMPEGEIAGMLAAETWLDADQALAAGFVTSIAVPLKLAAMAKATGFGFRHVPDRLKESTMPDAPDTAMAAVTAERTRISTIMALGSKHRVPATITSELVNKGIPLADAQATILDYLTTESDRAQIGHRFVSGGETLDNPVVRAKAMSDAVTARMMNNPRRAPPPSIAARR